MSKKTLSIVLILIFFFPFVLWNFVNCAEGYIPPTESYKKTPYQFEAAFNEQMAKYGMSIDIDSVNFTYGDSLYKKVPVVCEDGSKITCTYYPTSVRRKSLIEYIKFEQELTGQPSDKIYIEKLLQFLLDEFETVMTENKDESLDTASGVSYHEALRICKEFVEGDEQETSFSVFPEEHYGSGVTIKRKTEESTILSISLFI